MRVIKGSILRRLIRESLLREQAAKPWPGEAAWIKLFLPLIQAEEYEDAVQLMLDYGFKYDEIQLDLDDSDWKNQMVANSPDLPSGWRQEIEDIAWDIEDKRMTGAIANDPDRDWLAALGNAWSSSIEPDDMDKIKWKRYKNYVRLKPPPSISHGVGEIQVTDDDLRGAPGDMDDFVEFLERRAGGSLGRRKPYKRSPSSYYD